MSYSTELMLRILSGDPETENRRAARVEHLEEFVCRGDYRVTSHEIVTALLHNATLSRLCPAHASSGGYARAAPGLTRQSP